jgi:hypothetical protein
MTEETKMTNGKRKGNGKPRTFTKQLTVLLDKAVAEALALDAEIERTSPSAHSRKLLTEALVGRGRLRHPVLTAHPELDPSSK